jgi:hypothetical protein
MEMPKGCGSCPIANFGYCSINHKQVGDPLMGYPENRPANCPIICSLPEGHGRLVDADANAAVLEKCAEGAYLETGKLSYAYAARIFREAPTIVPAEAERSET